MRIKLAVLATIIVILIFTTIIYFRMADKSYAAEFLDVLTWQSAVWLPWILFGYLIDRLDRRFPIVEQTVWSWLLRHMLMCLVIMVLHFPWFFEISKTISPFLGAPETGYGVFRFFFLLWSMFDIFLYWSLLGAFAFIQLRSVLSPAEIAVVSDANRPVPVPDYFFVKSKGQQVAVKIQAIEWIEAEDYCCRIHVDGQSYLMRRSLRSFEELLPVDQFIRIHRSTIVNMDYVSSINGQETGRAIVTLKNGTQRPVSADGRARLKRLMTIPR